MVIQLNLIKYFISLMKTNFLFSFIVIFEFISILINWKLNIDIRIPCLFNFFFDIKCFGCGLARSFEYILDMNFSKAFETNSMIYPVILGVLILTIKDYKKFKMKSI